MDAASARISLSLLPLLVSVTIGCGGIGFYEKGPDPALLGAPASLSRSIDPVAGSFLLVAIRYPARVNASAMEAFVEACIRSNSVTGHVFGYTPKGDIPLHAQASIAELLSKTTYYAQELYLALSSRLPAGSVVLQPEEVVIGSDGSLQLQSNFSLPTAVVVDFWMKVSLLRAAEGRLWTGDTFGTSIYPRVRVTVGSASGDSDVTVAGGDWLYPSGVAMPSFIDDLRVTPDTKYTEYSGARRTARPAIEDALLVLSWKGYQCSKAELAAYETAELRNSEFAPFAEVWDMYANIVLDAINFGDHGRRTRAQQADYVTLFDEALARAVASGQTLGASDLDKLALVSDFIRLEREFLSGQDSKLVQDTYRGEWGDSMRVVRVSEAEFQDNLKQLMNRQVVASMFTAGISASAGIMTAKGDMSPQQNLAIQTQALGISLQTGAATSAAAHQLKEVFDNHFDGVREAQYERVVTIGNRTRTIQGHDLSEIREAEQDLYAEMF